MSETWEEHVARDFKVIAEIEMRPAQDENPPDDAHGKAGCFDCDLLWFGPAAAREAADHHTVAKHGIWVIGHPEN
jgi:hypothetical protein